MSPTLSSLLIYVLAILPAIGWILVYRHLDSKDPEPIKASSFALLAGVLSTLPVFALQLVFTLFPEFDLVSKAQANITNPLIFSSAFLVFVAFIEELTKGLAFLWVIRRYEPSFNQVVDGIVYGALVGIGFAFAENIYYFTRAIDVFQFSGNFLAVFSIRSFGTMLAHTLFTGLFGFYFAKAYFAPVIDHDSKSEKLWENVRHNIKQAFKLHATFLHLLPNSAKSEGRTFKRNVLIFEGFIVAILIHFLYNGLIKLEVFGQNWTFLIVPLIFVSAWYVWSRFFVKLYTMVINFVRVRKTDQYKAKIQP